jgi:hypothetical protein
MKKVIYMALLSLLITAFFSACERIVGKSPVSGFTDKGIAAQTK